MPNEAKTEKDEKEVEMEKSQNILPKEIESYMKNLEIRSDVLKKILEINKNVVEFEIKKE